MITNCPDRVLHVQDEGRLGKSDHCMISVTVECRPKTEKETGPTYNWKRADIPAIQRELDGVDWRKELENRTTEEGWILLRNKLQAAVEKFVPQSKNRTKLKNPWMTRELLRLIRRKRKVWRKVKRSKTAEDMAEYRSIEKEVSNKIRNAKRKLEKELVTGPDKNRKFTKYVKNQEPDYSRAADHQRQESPDRRERYGGRAKLFLFERFYERGPIPNTGS